MAEHAFFVVSLVVRGGGRVNGRPAAARAGGSAVTCLASTCHDRDSTGEYANITT
jgi:hypothetical protein